MSNSAEWPSFVKRSQFTWLKNHSSLSWLGQILTKFWKFVCTLCIILILLSIYPFLGCRSWLGQVLSKFWKFVCMFCIILILLSIYPFSGCKSWLGQVLSKFWTFVFMLCIMLVLPSNYPFLGCRCTHLIRISANLTAKKGILIKPQKAKNSRKT